MPCVCVVGCRSSHSGCCWWCCQVARNFWLRCWSRDQEIASEDGTFPILNLRPVHSHSCFPLTVFAAWRSVLKEAGIADKKEQVCLSAAVARPGSMRSQRALTIVRRRQGELIELSKSAKAKEKLKATTDEAIEAGTLVLCRLLPDHSVFVVSASHHTRLTHNWLCSASEGAFGAPTLIVHMPGGEKEMFFGSDRCV